MCVCVCVCVCVCTFKLIHEPIHWSANWFDQAFEQN